MFELRQIEQFLAVVENETVSKAADALNMTQPALSRSIQNLEYELGVSLFDRGKNKVTLNETGELAAKKARALMEAARIFKAEVQGFYRANSQITIGSCAPSEALYAVIHGVEECYNGTKCTFCVEDEETILKKLSSGVYQIALFTHEVNDSALFQIPVSTEQLFVMLPDGHPLLQTADKDGVTFSKINGEAVIPFPLKGYWNDLLALKLPDSVLLYQSNIETFDKVVHSSNLISFASDALPIELKNHTAVRVKDSEAKITYHAACLKSRRDFFAPLFQLLKAKGSTVSTPLPRR